MAKIVELPDGREAEFPDDMSNDAIGAVLQKQFAPQQSATPEAPKPQTNSDLLRQQMGPSDFTKSFASTPARMLKSTMQMLGTGDYVPDAVSNAAAEGDKSVAGRIAGDVAGTGGIRAGAGALTNALQRLNAARGFVPALGRVAEAGTYGAAQGAVTTPDDQANAAMMGAAGGAAMPVLGGALNLAGRGAANILGTTTGAGAESVRQAFRNGSGFVENMRGHVEPGTVVDSARQGIQTMRQNMQSDYRAAVPQWATNHPIDFAPVDRAYNNLIGTLQHGGQWKIGQNEIRTVDEIGQVLNEFRANPANHTAEGFDALKQRLQAIYPDSPAYRQAQRAVTTMADAVRNQISQQSPVYANAMRDYWQRSQQLDEIERSLSLGDRNTVDTALRKLQSLMRNNVNSNFGQRVQSANALAQTGGVDIMPQVAGQALNSWTPRGLQGAVGVGGSIVNPSAIPALPAMSPRVVGEAARYSGMVVNDPRTAAILEALRRFVPSATRNLSGGDKNGNE